MASPLLYLATTVILSCAVAAFSRGAGPASCQTMSPGHIRAQPQDPKQSHVTIRTSLRSYLPGQLVTVTVRSSRDFMGFLLQARSGVDPEAGAAAGSPAEGPVLVGGSWTLAPPGTHTLRCLSEGDTLTHSDKQLKRNLSFVWRAPDAPVGDVRFYITVVQSYFVYWAGIKSAVVRDGSRSLWTGRNTTGAERERAVFGLRDENLTAVPASRKAPLDVSEDTTTQPSFTRSSSQEKKSPGFSALPNPPPKSISIILSSPFQMVSSSTSSTFLMSGVINSPPSARLSSSNPGTGSSLSSSTTTRSPAVPSSSSSSSFSTKACVPSTSHPSPSIPTSVGPSSLILPTRSSSQATSPHPGPSPAPRQSDDNRPSIPPPPFPSPRQIRVASSDPKQKRKPSTSSRKLQSNIGGVLKPKSAKPDTKLPFNPSKSPGMEGKYPETVPRHSSWELGMLLGCSAGLGMALVVGVRYVYRQACGKRTEVTLNDRERDYGRGERRMIQVQECGDLVRVRRIRENSLVLLAEYDILASPGD
ncbi:reelin domain-containing protein 1-like [Phycodurus eques]|uniref:reelin domain-containing protein 1-like n=1 Tax=Phycodurus eques TaxID=693459 RepID=UPI002ACDB843|nr:reelin domain-containing protein 1-like [Phycodurus eques]